MAVGNLIKRIILKQDELYLRKEEEKGIQEKVLRQLLTKAADTAFGKKYRFREMLEQKDMREAFKANIPVFTYDSMHDEWWHRTLKDEADVCWPGTISYFALSSGTTASASKRIPVSKEMILSIKRASLRLFSVTARNSLPKGHYSRDILAIGGSTALTVSGQHKEGDISGILAARSPLWYKKIQKPTPHILKMKEWSSKLEAIVNEAPQWNVGTISGLPSWIILVLEKIIQHHRVKNIHEIWPGFAVFISGGMALAPYKKKLESLCGKPVLMVESYFASEGYIGRQARTHDNALKLLLYNGIYFEFIPFTEENFYADGSLKDNADVLNVDEVKENIEYAIVLSTNAGAWRYLIGDTVRFTNAKQKEILVTGRIKHYLSVCGEHLSVENMNAAIRYLSETTEMEISDFTVTSIDKGTYFAHHWYIACSNHESAEKLISVLDKELCRLNDDYATFRKTVLDEVRITIIKPEAVNEWMKKMGKAGGQHKFPRVMNKEQLGSWLEFLQSHPALITS